jgi:hypothetical protein
MKIAPRTSKDLVLPKLVPGTLPLKGYLCRLEHDPFFLVFLCLSRNQVYITLTLFPLLRLLSPAVTVISYCGVVVSALEFELCPYVRYEGLISRIMLNSLGRERFVGAKKPHHDFTNEL